MIKSLSKQNGSIPTLTCKGVDITTDTDKADQLNNQFLLTSLLTLTKLTG